VDAEGVVEGGGGEGAGDGEDNGVGGEGDGVVEVKWDMMGDQGCSRNI